MTENEMKRNFTTNIEYFIAKSGLQQKEVAAALNIAPTTFNTWCVGKILPTLPKLQKIAEYFGIQVEDLIQPMSERKATYPSRLSPLPVGRQGKLPIYGTVSAGLGEYVDGENDILGWEPVDGKFATDEHFYLRVKGDSMSPKIEDGDLVLVRKQPSVDSGDIGVFLVDGDEGFVKRVKYDTDYIVLLSLNPLYEPITFIGEDVLRVRVVGKVLRVVKIL